MIKLREALQYDVGFTVLGLGCIWWLLVHQWLGLAICFAVLVTWAVVLVRNMSHCGTCDKIIRTRHYYCNFCGDRTERL